MITHSDLQNQALESFQKGDYQKSILLYEACIEEQPEVITYYWSLGLSYLLAGDELEAQNIWSSVLLEVDPVEVESFTEDLIIFLDQEGSQHISLNHLETAKAIYLHIREIAPHLGYGYLGLGMIREKQRKFPEAVQHFLKFIEIEPEFYLGYYHLGFCYHHLKEYKLAIGHLQKCIEMNPHFLEAYFTLAVCQGHIQQIDQAIATCQQALLIHPDSEKSYTFLGYFLSQAKEFELAIQALEKALSIHADSFDALYYLGICFQKIEQLNEAIFYLEKALSLNTHNLDLYNILGEIYEKLGQLEQAKTIYQQEILVEPEYFLGYMNLANILSRQSQYEQAIEYYEKAISLKLDHIDLLENFSEVLQKTGHFKRALHCSLFASVLNKDHVSAIDKVKQLQDLLGKTIETYSKLYKFHEILQHERETISILEEAIVNHPTTPEFYQYLIRAFHVFGENERVLQTYEKANQIFPDNLMIKKSVLSGLPVIYNTPQEIEFYRFYYAKVLDEILQISITSEEEIKAARKALEVDTNFYLCYQGYNDRDLQKKHRSFVEKAIAKIYPQFQNQFTPIHLNPSQKLKIGFLSTNLYNHNGTNWSLGWMKNLNREKFDIYCYHTGSKTDFLTEKFQAYSDSFYHFFENLEATCQQVLEDQLHVLIHLDIGMNPETDMIAALRLAPIQCTTWGHPVTSGFSTIDYYLSSELMEPENGEDHYTETLIRLPNLGVHYEKFAIPQSPKTRSDFQLSETAVLYLSNQSLHKYLPQYDYIFPAIAKQVPQAQFVFFETTVSPAITKQFKQRLHNAFQQYDLNSQDYCLFLPRLSFENYLHVNLLCDVYLNTLEWSGGHTIFHAIACHLPVVTCPGQFMRGRLGYGMVKMLGVTETLAQDEADYINIAVRLGLESQWRQDIVKKIQTHQSRIFEDTTCVTALEQFFEQAVALRMPNDELI